MGFVLTPDFTMLALAAFLDTLRLAGDEGDRSRQVDCVWRVTTEDGRDVRASNGIVLRTDGGLGDPAAYDYLVVVGGTLHRGRQGGDRLAAHLRSAAALGVPLVGVCTGSFVLARAGLMAGRRCCVSWFHRSDFELEFPDLAVESDRLFVADRERITCAGGTGVIHLASHLVERHLGVGRSAKGLRVMLEEGPRPSSAPQPQPDLPELGFVADARLRRALLMMERRLEEPEPIAQVARAVGLSERQLGRLFRSELGRSPMELRDALRLARARALIARADLPMGEIALRCGFADGSHLARRFRQRYAESPTAARRRLTANAGATRGSVVG